MKLLIINGPNLNLLGKREPEIYGHVSFENFLDDLKKEHPSIEFDYFQSNVEGEIINCLHKNGFSDSNLNGIIINPGGYSHTSIAIADAIAGIETKVVEVHLSNIYAREEFRHHSLTARGCVGVISGFGLNSYKLAIDYLINK